jgi:hypothetical protein
MGSLRPAARIAAWSAGLAALAPILAMRFNIGFYEFWVNYDARGGAQQHELIATRHIFRHTSGVLCGQLLALLAGLALTRRFRHRTALALAVPLSLLLAAVVVAVGFPIADVLGRGYGHTTLLGDPSFQRVWLAELAAYPLVAAGWVALGRLLAGRLPVAVPVILLGWGAATLTGLLQDDRFAGPAWLLWTVPPVAAATAIALNGLSMDVWFDPPVLVGDWGHQASTALLISAAAWAAGLNLLAAMLARRRSMDPAAPAALDA